MSEPNLKPECEEALHELWGYLDGELTDEKRKAITHHLDECPPCVEAQDFEAELRKVIAQKCREEVPESLRHRIAEAIGEIEKSG